MLLVRTLLTLSLVSLVPACGAGTSMVPPALADAAEKHDALALSDALEALISAGKDTSVDREYAFDQLKMRDDGTASYAFARAAVTGRLVQLHGLTKSLLVGDIERYARQSIALDPNFRNGAAKRMLGTLYVLAPSALLKHGDSEKGLELLQGLVKKRPDILENHLRLAEAYIALGDMDAARVPLCVCKEKKAALRKDDQILLDRLLHDAGTVNCEASVTDQQTPSSP